MTTPNETPRPLFDQTFPDAVTREPRSRYDRPTFDGETYEPEHDEIRLHAQLLRTYTVMRDGTYRTLSEISAETHDPEASVSARLRDLRKKRFGSHDVQRRRRGEEKRGLYEYAVDPPKEDTTHAD